MNDAGTSQSRDASSENSLGQSDSGNILPGSDAGIGPIPGNPCNGSDGYCSKRYDELCYATTHNSAANSTVAWESVSQTQTIRAQLDNGARALMLSVQTRDNLDLVCYGDCARGNALLSTLLRAVKDFFVGNPREVVTLLIDSQIPAAKLQSDFAAAGLDSFAFTHETGQPWPTLGELIDLNRRLVILANIPDSGPTWLLPRSSYVWETGSNWSSPQSMTCSVAVGSASLPFGLVHHYLADEDTDASAGYTSTQLNSVTVAAARLSRCAEEHGRPPNFIAADFIEAGDIVGATQVINGIRKL